MIRSRALPKLFFLLAAACLLASCAVQPPAPPAGQQPLETLREWRMDGKLGFRSPEKNGSAWINWVQRHDAYDLRLTGPFGASATRIQGDSNFAVLSQSGRDDVYASSGEELSEWLFGWQFPVAQLVSWVKGLPADAPPPEKIATTPAGLLDSLQQQGWTLRYSHYRQEGAWVLPGRIQGEKDSYAFTLVINKWHLPDDVTAVPPSSP